MTLIHYQKSRYEDIIVEDRKNIRYLYFGSDAIQSAMLKAQPSTLMLPYLQVMMAFLLLTDSPPIRIGIAGLGGGSLLRFIDKHLPLSKCDVVDYDPVLWSVAKTYFGLPEDPNRHQYWVADGWQALRDQPPLKYDALLVDLCNTSSMAYFTNIEDYYVDCYRCLSLNGILAINLWVYTQTQLLSVLQIIRSVFYGRVLCVEVPGYSNVIAYAFKQRPSNRSFDTIEGYANRLQAQMNLNLTNTWQAISKINPNLKTNDIKRNLWDIVP